MGQGCSFHRSWWRGKWKASKVNCCETVICCLASHSSVVESGLHQRVRQFVVHAVGYNYLQFMQISKKPGFSTSSGFASFACISWFPKSLKLVQIRLLLASHSLMSKFVSYMEREVWQIDIILFFFAHFTNFQHSMGLKDPLRFTRNNLCQR